MHEKTFSIIQEILKPGKPLVAIKAWKEFPEDIPAYEDKAFPGTCTQVSEVMETGKTFYIQTKNVYCTGGCNVTIQYPFALKKQLFYLIRIGECFTLHLPKEL